jgi:hypothetical protein
MKPDKISKRHNTLLTFTLTLKEWQSLRATNWFRGAWEHSREVQEQAMKKIETQFKEQMQDA